MRSLSKIATCRVQVAQAECLFSATLRDEDKEVPTPGPSCEILSGEAAGGGIANQTRLGQSKRAT